MDSVAQEVYIADEAVAAYYRLFDLLLESEAAPIINEPKDDET